MGRIERKGRRTDQRCSDERHTHENATARVLYGKQIVLVSHGCEAVSASISACFCTQASFTWLASGRL